MTSLDHASPAPRARVAVLRSLDEAERVAALLRRHDIDTLVETDDALAALPGQSLLPGVLPVPGGLFAYPVTVLPRDRERAGTLLDAHRASGNSPTPRQLLRWAALAMAAGAAALVIRAAAP